MYKAKSAYADSQEMLRDICQTMAKIKFRFRSAHHNIHVLFYGNPMVDGMLHRIGSARFGAMKCSCSSGGLARRMLAHVCRRTY